MHTNNYERIARNLYLSTNTFSKNECYKSHAKLKSLVHSFAVGFVFISKIRTHKTAKYFHLHSLERYANS